jgi:hypothetical protein
MFNRQYSVRNSNDSCQLKLPVLKMLIPESCMKINEKLIILPAK